MFRGYRLHLAHWVHSGVIEDHDCPCARTPLPTAIHLGLLRPEPFWLEPGARVLAGINPAPGRHLLRRNSAVRTHDFCESVPIQKLSKRLSKAARTTNTLQDTLRGPVLASIPYFDREKVIGLLDRLKTSSPPNRSGQGG
jgi:hypothetical protein